MKSALDQVVLSECWQILKLICQNSSKLTFNVRKVKVSPVSISSDKDT